MNTGPRKSIFAFFPWMYRSAIGSTFTYTSPGARDIFTVVSQHAFLDVPRCRICDSINIPDADVNAFVLHIFELRIIQRNAKQASIVNVYFIQECTAAELFILLFLLDDHTQLLAVDGA